MGYQQEHRPVKVKVKVKVRPRVRTHIREVPAKGLITVCRAILFALEEKLTDTLQPMIRTALMTAIVLLVLILPEVHSHMAILELYSAII